jgi:hypothetical protein
MSCLSITGIQITVSQRITVNPAASNPEPTIVALLVLPAALRELKPLATLPVLAFLVWLSSRERQPAQLTAPQR